MDPSACSWSVSQVYHSDGRSRRHHSPPASARRPVESRAGPSRAGGCQEDGLYFVLARRSTMPDRSSPRVCDSRLRAQIARIEGGLPHRPSGSGNTRDPSDLTVRRDWSRLPLTSWTRRLRPALNIFSGRAWPSATLLDDRAPLTRRRERGIRRVAPAPNDIPIVATLRACADWLARNPRGADAFETRSSNGAPSAAAVRPRSGGSSSTSSSHRALCCRGCVVAGLSRRRPLLSVLVLPRIAPIVFRPRTRTRPSAPAPLLTLVGPGAP